MFFHVNTILHIVEFRHIEKHLPSPQAPGFAG
jgi:hypothetical protein